MKRWLLLKGRKLRVICYREYSIITKFVFSYYPSPLIQKEGMENAESVNQGTTMDAQLTKAILFVRSATKGTTSGARRRWRFRNG